MIAISDASHERASIRALTDAECVADPVAAIRARARRLIEEVRSLGPWSGPPFDMRDLASFQGLTIEETLELNDQQDACVLPGRVLLNARKAVTRQRYSLAHEIGHTLFPDYAELVSAGGAVRQLDIDTESNVERLCQIAASELLFPMDPFEDRMREAGVGLLGAFRLGDEFVSSTEAAARRMADFAPMPFAALTFRPITEHGTWMNLDGALGHSPYAQIEAIGAAVSVHFPGDIPRRIRPPKSSAADRAWKRATITRRRIQIERHAAEIWPVLDAQLTWIAEACVLPKGGIPRQVLALLWVSSACDPSSSAAS